MHKVKATIGSKVKSYFKSCLKTTEANLTKFHGKILHNVEVCRIRTKIATPNVKVVVRG